MTTDRELLELAANAARLRINNYLITGGLSVCSADRRSPHNWNPLADDGDAFRLAVELGVTISRQANTNGQFAVAEAERQIFCPEPWFPDPYSATRRAIVRAAAEIGKVAK